jgi:hypothetical protein
MGEGYKYLVQCPFGDQILWKRTRRPNVTVHGPIRYAIEDGKFYLLDEDGYTFEMFVVEKALLPAKAESPATAAPK